MMCCRKRWWIGMARPDQPWSIGRHHICSSCSRNLGAPCTSCWTENHSSLRSTGTWFLLSLWSSCLHNQRNFKDCHPLLESWIQRIFCGVLCAFFYMAYLFYSMQGRIPWCGSWPKLDAIIIMLLQCVIRPMIFWLDELFWYLSVAVGLLFIATCMGSVFLGYLTPRVYEPISLGCWVLNSLCCLIGWDPEFLTGKRNANRHDTSVELQFKCDLGRISHKIYILSRKMYIRKNFYLQHLKLIILK